MTNDPRYPIGKFQPPPNYTPDLRADFIRKIAETPAQLRAAIAGLSDQQLDHRYRDGGWTVRQVVHHLADSHMNSYLRFKFAVTEDEPTIKPYDEKVWAELADAAHGDLEMSLTLLEGLHQRWVLFLRSLNEAQFSRKFLHPEQGPVTVDRTLALYAWHGRHHVAHITKLRERMGW
jgi:uncharacterized damage-inducible protein DinB